METFTFCLEIIRKEGERFNVGVNSNTASQITAATAENFNYDIAHNRCSYLYRYGTINLSFAKECFTKFFSDYKSIAFLLSKWINSPNLTVCSLSKGPALDYIAFLLAFQDCGMFPSIFKNVKVISKYGAWRNTVNIMHQIITEGYLKSLPAPVIGNIEVIQGDPFMDLSEKVKDPISNSDIVLMLKKLNLQADMCNQDKITKSVQEFLAALKPDAILFCFDTKPSVALITKEISAFPGTYLLQPTFMNTIITLEHTEFYKDIFGCFPVLSARGSFFVWQKCSLVPSTSHLGYLMDEVSESVKQLLRSNNDDNYCDMLPGNNSDSEKVITNSSHLSTPTYFVESCSKLYMSNKNLNSTAIESGNEDELAAYCTNITPQISKKLSLNSLHRDFLTHVEENILSKEICMPVNKSVQTEQENNFKSPESVKIAALTKKIENLTAVLKDSLETNKLKNACTGNGCLECAEEQNKCVSNACIPNHYSSESSYLHKCNFECSENNICNFTEEKAHDNYCSHHIYKQGLLCNGHNSNIAVNCNNKATMHCNTQCHMQKFHTEKKSIPKLVIPLNNLSGNVITQIISLISQSNLEL